MKKKIREKIIIIRKKLSKSEVLEKSKKIKKRLYAMTEFKMAKTILFYISYDNEVFTHDMIKECLSNKKIVVPISDKKNRNLILSELKKWDDLKPGSYDILEPIPEKISKISSEDIEVIIVPGVVFDINGNRIGHGKGYYDNLLKNSKKTVNIGLAFEFQILDKIPTEEHDLPVDVIITEERIINCKH